MLADFGNGTNKTSYSGYLVLKVDMPYQHIFTIVKREKRRFVCVQQFSKVLKLDGKKADDNKASWWSDLIGY